MIVLPSGCFIITSIVKKDKASNFELSFSLCASTFEEATELAEKVFANNGLTSPSFAIEREREWVFYETIHQAYWAIENSKILNKPTKLIELKENHTNP